MKNYLLIIFLLLNYYPIKSINQNINKDLKLSILIPTLEKRKTVFNKLYNKLIDQIEKFNLKNNVEIVVSCDNGQKPTGQKRNELLQKSNGLYTCFLDDDDDVSNDYIKLIYDATLKDPDCISLTGIITFDGKNPKKFIHSIKYDSYFEKNNIYYRPPNHLNPIKRDIAIKFKFPNKYISEDTDWAMQICRSGLIKNEVEINEPYYFYLYRSKK